MKHHIIVARDNGINVSIDTKPLVKFLEELNRKENHVLREEMVSLMKHLCDKITPDEKNPIERLNARLLILMTYSELLSSIQII